jgi:hypothetical protein
MKMMNGKRRMGSGTAMFLLLFAIHRPLFAAFEEIGAGARPIGMGSAFTAVADDANTVYYNPAGLGQLKHPQLTAGYGRLSMGLSDDSDLGSGFLAAIAPLKGGALGSLGVDILNLQLSGAYREDIVSLAYGRELRPGLAGGAALKFMRRSYGSDAYTAIDPLFQRNGRSADAVSLDLGALYRRSRHFVYALQLKDANSPDVGLGSTDRVPMTVKAGFAYYQRAFVLSTELQRKKDENGLLFGAERWMMGHRAAVRGGFDFGSGSRRNMALGASLRFGNGQVDYAFLLPLSGITDTAGTHRLGFTMRFGSADAGPVALLEQEELLGPSRGPDPRELAALREEFAKETDSIQRRVRELEGQLSALREIAAAASAAPPAAPPPPAPAPVPAPEPAPEPAPAVPELDVNALQNELMLLRKELEKRRTAPAAAPKPRDARIPSGTYIVKQGDTLQSIALRAWGDPDRWTEIYQANKERIKRGGAVTPGQILVIP